MSKKKPTGILADSFVNQANKEKVTQQTYTSDLTLQVNARDFFAGSDNGFQTLEEYFLVSLALLTV